MLPETTFLSTADLEVQGSGSGEQNPAPDIERLVEESLEADLSGDPIGELPEVDPEDLHDDSADTVRSVAGLTVARTLSMSQATSILRSLGFRIRTTGEAK